MGQGDPATVSGFRLDAYLVSVGRFAQFVRAWNGGRGLDGGAGYDPPAGSGAHTHLNGGNGLNATGGGYEPGWLASDDAHVAPTPENLNCSTNYATWTAGDEHLPMNCVNWYEAYAFCIWDGGFLPSESEWEFAAAGGSKQLEYPWGSVAPGTSNRYAIYGGAAQSCYYPSETLTACTGVPNIAPVGYAELGAGLWGQVDMAGEVWQWTLDWFAPYFDPCTDCVNATAGTATSRVRRGGAFTNPATSLQPGLPLNRVTKNPADRDATIGFRCARTP
jgi:formylglycine-generating enzyme required for sulfatase activity